MKRLVSIGFACLFLSSVAHAQGPLDAQIQSIQRDSQAIQSGTYGVPPPQTAQPSTSQSAQPAQPQCGNACQAYCGSRRVIACYVSQNRCTVTCQ